MNAPTPRAPNATGLVTPPRVSITRDGNGVVSMTFDTQVGRSYRVEYKNSLAEEAWTLLRPAVLAGSGQLTVLDDVRASSQRFYRIVQLD
jgi:hypothetical protein